MSDDTHCPLCKEQFRYQDPRVTVWYDHYKAYAHAFCVVVETDDLRATIARLHERIDRLQTKLEGIDAALAGGGEGGNE